MAKKTNPKKKEKTTCRQLSELQTEDLARLIISEAGYTDISRGTGENSPRYPRLLYGEPHGRKNQPYDKGEF